jgi:hypothetical protein
MREVMLVVYLDKKRVAKMVVLKVLTRVERREY